MDAQLEIKLIECLSLLDEGEPIERILARFPEDAQRLRPLLETAGLLPSLALEPTDSARLTSRRAFLNQGAALREQRQQRWGWLPQRHIFTLASVLVVFLLLGGAGVAAQSALPNSMLYPFKRAIEGTELLLASPGQQATLSASFAQRRRDEISALLAGGGTADVSFTGPIEAIAGNRWQVGGLSIQITPATAITGTPLIGAQASVQGHVANGQFVASFVTMDDGSTPAPLPTATASATPAPTQTAMPTQPPTALPTAVNISTAQPTAQPPVQPTTQPTARPSNTSVPTAVPPPPTAVPQPTVVPPPPTIPPPIPTEQPPTETEVEFEGRVDAIGGAAWQIAGQTVTIDGGTEIRGSINVGDTVRVKARRLVTGQLIAERIELRTDNSGSGGGDNSGSGGSDNSGGGSGSDDHGGSSGGGNDSGGGGGGGGGDGSSDGSGGGGGNDSHKEDSGSGGSDNSGSGGSDNDQPKN